jgi:hypothetical protein
VRFCNLLCIYRAPRAADQQSNRALCRPRDTSPCCMAVGRSERRGFLDLLPEASLQLAVILLASNVLLHSEDLLLASKTCDQAFTR